MPILAIPIFDDEVAPRFCAAEEIFLVEFGPGSSLSRKRSTIVGLDVVGRLRQLSLEGASVLLCCGFAARFLPQAHRLGIEVIWGLAGKTEQVVAAYLENDLDSCRMLPLGGCPRRKRRMAGCLILGGLSPPGRPPEGRPDSEDAQDRAKLKETKEKDES